jgi:hypothetical protein
MTQPPPRETDKDKLIQAIGQHTQNTTATYERAKAELLTVCVEDLIKSIDNNSQKGHALARKIFWLNVVLTSATAIGAIVAILTLLCI